MAVLPQWVTTALAHAAAWLRIETVNRRTGELQLDAVIHPFDRPQTWTDPANEQAHTWIERVLLVEDDAVPTTELPVGEGELTVRRRALAEWMTAADNPYFARAVVNRPDVLQRLGPHHRALRQAPLLPISHDRYQQNRDNRFFHCAPLFFSRW